MKNKTEKSVCIKVSDNLGTQSAASTEQQPWREWKWEGGREKERWGDRERKRRKEMERRQERLSTIPQIFAQSDWKNGDNIYWNRRVMGKMDKFFVVVTNVEIKKAG